MILPKIKVILIPNCVCLRCGQHGYVGEKSYLCLGCLNPSLSMYHRKRGEEKSKADREEAEQLKAQAARV